MKAGAVAGMRRRWPAGSAWRAGSQLAAGSGAAAPPARAGASRGSRLRRIGERLAGAASFLPGGSGAAEAPRQLPHRELVHLVFQRAQGDAQVLGGSGDVAAVLLERAQDEVALEGIG